MGTNCPSERRRDTTGRLSLQLAVGIHCRQTEMLSPRSLPSLPQFRLPYGKIGVEGTFSGQLQRNHPVSSQYWNYSSMLPSLKRLLTMLDQNTPVSRLTRYLHSRRFQH